MFYDARKFNQPLEGLNTSNVISMTGMFKQASSFNQPLNVAFKTAVGMSLLSMIAMETSMNLVDYLMTGGAIINIYTILPMLLAGFITPLPYNYYRLKKFKESCH